MFRLPVITGFGGMNPAGRSSFHQGYRRLIAESLPAGERQQMLTGLATMMGYVAYSNGEYRDATGKSYTPAQLEQYFAEPIFNNTLIRRISTDHFDADHIATHKALSLSGVGGELTFSIPKKQLPQPLPEGWHISQGSNAEQVTVSLAQPLPVKVSTTYSMAVQAAGQLPTGFELSTLYPSRFHPRGLQMAIAGASDAVNSLGIPWETICASVAPDEIGVYASSIMSQIDENGYAGLLQARLKAGRVSTKQLVLGFNSMPADFINAYVLGNMGATGSITGACASFLYNLRMGIEDIRSNRRRVVMVGSSEAPITPEVIDGYATMGALASDEKLRKLDGGTLDYQRASRPFGDNCGFTIAESSQYIILMDDALAVELGADIYGSVSDVFVNADGFKKSISAPGPGNYLTFAKAVASARSILGEQAIRNRSFVQAHGSSTPQNRTTESAILDRVASAFGIENWPVTAIKSYLGHSLASASGDQMVTTLGVFSDQYLPGIKTIKEVADDVHDERLRLSTSDQALEEPPEVAFLNSKGFGGNNATACVLSPQVTEKMIAQRHGKQSMSRYYDSREKVRDNAQSYHHSALQGNFKTIYKFGEHLIDDDGITLSENSIEIAGFKESINLDLVNPYSDMV